MRKNIYRFGAILSILFLVLGFLPSFLFAQQVGIAKPPSVNCPVSLYDHARAIKSGSASFGNQANFTTFFDLYKKFASTYNSLSGDSYYVIKWNVPNNVGWAVEYYERVYNLPVFPNNGGSPSAVYPKAGGAMLPLPFSLTKEEMDALNTIHKQVPAVADKLISDIWLLQFFETECGEKINLANIPNNPFEQNITGYGKIRANSQSFTIALDQDLWTRTDASSFTVSGVITAQKEVMPSLKIAYGVDKKNLNFLAPATGAYFFNSPLALKDSASIPPLKISIAHLSKDIKDNMIYFAVVDAKNTDLSYSDTQELTLGQNTGLVNFSLPIGTSQSVPSVNDNKGMMESICDGPDCTFNDLIKLFTNFWKFILIIIVPIVAIMTAWIGFNFMQSGAEYREKAKEMTWSMVKGVVLILFAWFIVKTILDFTVGKDSCYSFLGKGKIDPKCVEPNK